MMSGLTIVYSTRDSKRGDFAGQKGYTSGEVLMALGAVGKKESLAEKAYRMLKNAILDGELKPGEILTEEGMAELMQISRTPVRSALQQLTLEGMLRTERKNLVVAGVKEEEIKDIDQVRAELEPLSAALNCKKGLSKDQVMELTEYCERQKKAARDKDVRAFFLNGEQFHVRLADFSGNGYLADMISRSSAAAVRYLMNQEDPEKYLDDSGEEHEAVLASVLAGDPESARLKMRQHVQKTE